VLVCVVLGTVLLVRAARRGRFLGPSWKRAATTAAA